MAKTRTRARPQLLRTQRGEDPTDMTKQEAIEYFRANGFPRTSLKTINYMIRNGVLDVYRVVAQWTGRPYFVRIRRKDADRCIAKLRKGVKVTPAPKVAAEA